MAIILFNVAYFVELTKPYTRLVSTLVSSLKCYFFAWVTICTGDLQGGKYKNGMIYSSTDSARIATQALFSRTAYDKFSTR